MLSTRLAICAAGITSRMRPPPVAQRRGLVDADAGRRAQVQLDLRPRPRAGRSPARVQAGSDRAGMPAAAVTAIAARNGSAKRAPAPSARSSRPRYCSRTTARSAARNAAAAAPTVPGDSPAACGVVPLQPVLRQRRHQRARQAGRRPASRTPRLQPAG